MFFYFYSVDRVDGICNGVKYMGGGEGGGGRVIGESGAYERRPARCIAYATTDLPMVLIRAGSGEIYREKKEEKKEGYIARMLACLSAVMAERAFNLEPKDLLPLTRAREL